MTVFCFVSRLRRSFKKRAHRACTHKTNSLAAGIFSLETLESRKYLAVSPMAFSSGIEQIEFGGKIVEALNDQYILRMQQKSPSTNSFDYKHAVPVVPKNWSSAPIGYGFYKISAPETSLAQVQAWGTKAGAKYVEPSLVSHFSRVPNDPMYGNYSPDQTTNLPGLYGMKQIGMETAWNTSTGSSSVVVAVIDSGIDTTHPDLRSNLWVNRGEIPGNGRDDDGNGYVDDVNGWNAAFGNGNVQDVNGHGTHVSGTIAAAGNNAIGVAGVNWQAKIMAVDVDANTGGGIIGIDAGLAYVIKQKQLGTNVVAINASYGGPGFSQAAKDLYALAGRVGITVVAAAGNDGTNNTLSPGYPASYDLSNIISVAATDQTDALASFSNFGKASVDLGAPGVGILSTLPRTVLASDFNPTDTNNDSVPLGYGYLDGTSMAAPHVTGAVALLKAIKPSATVAEIRDAILGSVQKRGALTTFVATGGRLSVAGAVSRLIASPTLSIAGASVSEGNVGTRAMTFSITANHGTSSGITVRYATSGGTATAGGVDYRAVSGVARILPWQTSTTFTVLVTGDRTVEPDEYFTVTLSNAIGGTIEKGTAFGGIFNDDGTTPSSFPSTIPSFFSLSSASGLSSAFVAEAVEVSSKSVAQISTTQLKSPQSASFFNAAAFASDQPTVVSGKPAKKFAF